MKRRGLLNKHICKKKQISPIRQKKLQISSFPIISLWELKVAIATRVLIRLEQKTQLFVPPIGPAASEKKSFENVDDGWTTDTSIY